MEPADTAVGDGLDRISQPNVGLEIRLVHADRSRIVIDGDMRWSAEPHLQAGAGAPPPDLQ